MPLKQASEPLVLLSGCSKNGLNGEKKCTFHVHLLSMKTLGIFTFL